MPKTRDSLTLTQLRYFRRVAELGSITAAADELFVAQSGVSTAMHQLEKSLDATLFIRRRSKGVVLTEQGRAFHSAVVRVLESVDDAVGTLSPGKLTGTLAAGCFTTLAPYWLPEVLEQLHASSPDLTCELREVTADKVISLLQRREIEVALTYDFDYGRDIDFERITEAPIYAAVAADDPLAQRQSVSLSELSRLPLILLDMDKSTNYFLSLFRDAHLRPVIHQKFESMEVVRSMVARGHGYTILNQRPSHDLTNDGRCLTRLPIAGVRSHLQTGVAYRSGEPLSTKGQEFLKACRNALLQE
ncbi:MULTISPECIES: LysR family transcriptional regulator [unclassified Corynebacterium]|uniref:LysR family transcriptional regulator n=1 Tax=unclassified Corynebacterium TaxID=2624378 RepID=UPI002648DED6|nr:LysR family transcriptional regulator [Corynebacterium sp.]MDN5587053.1 LysR family transcriptional regulator [Brevibacterium sp.]MDN5605423.1 LysR family transcriptional regulator [Kocuria sp.]MDN5719309.1 LysR family transcriptional regulator [Corynebacterium sp.]